ncbi:MAG: hypothetical protein V3S29_09870, partial [bacterium]
MASTHRPAGRRRAAPRRWAGPPVAPLLAALCLAGAAALHPPTTRAAPPRPELAAAASALFPGAGQFLNGETGEAALHAGFFLVSLGQYLRLASDGRYLPIDRRAAGAEPGIQTNRVTAYADLSYFAAQNVSLYSAFAAYRDGRQAMANTGYRTPAPKESLTQLATAPFSLAYLTRPLTLAALAVPLYFALTPRDDGRL